MKALILDGHLKSALAIVRSLGKENITFSVGSTRKTASALHSKYTAETFIYTSPLVDRDKFIDDVIKEAIRLGDRPLVYASSDATFLALARSKKAQEFITILHPQDESVETAFNKKRTQELANRLGILTPKTHSYINMEELKNSLDTFSYPLIVKPQHTASWDDGRGFNGEVMFVHSETELLSRAQRVFEETAEMPLIQEVLHGAEYGVEVLCELGKVRSLCVHKRMRSLSPKGGASVVKETVGDSEKVTAMKNAAEDLMKELKWHGVAMIEFKLNDKHEPVLLEINGRFWGSLPLAIYAGIDFPVLYYNLALKKEIKTEVYTIGITSKHLLGDISHLSKVLFSKDPLREVVYPTRVAAIQDFFTSTNVRYDVIQQGDMKPFFMEIVDVVFKKLFNR